MCCFVLLCTVSCAVAVRPVMFSCLLFLCSRRRAPHHHQCCTRTRNLPTHSAHQSVRSGGIGKHKYRTGNFSGFSMEKTARYHSSRSVVTFRPMSWWLGYFKAKVYVIIKGRHAAFRPDHKTLLCCFNICITFLCTCSKGKVHSKS